MPRLRPELVLRQEQDGFLTVAEGSRRSGLCERTLREWMRKGTVKVRRVGPMLMFVEAASLAAATGGAPGVDDEEILADLRGDEAAGPRPSAPNERPIRELTLERDE